jgi:hypothetical protein
MQYSLVSSGLAGVGTVLACGRGAGGGGREGRGREGERARDWAREPY